MSPTADAARLSSPGQNRRPRRSGRRRDGGDRRRHAAPPPRRPLPEQLHRVRAQGPRRIAEVAHRRSARQGAETSATGDAARRPRPRLRARQRARRCGDGAGDDLDRPCQHADPGRRQQHPHRPDLFRARFAARLRRPETPPAAGFSARGPATHRRRRGLAQPLQPPRRAEHQGARRAGRRATSLHRPARRQGMARRRRHRQCHRARLVAERARRRGRDRLHAGAALVRAVARRPDGNAVGRLRDPRPRLPGLLRRRHRVLEGLRRHPRPARGAPRRRARLRPRADPDRRLRAALVHELATRRPERGRADPSRPRRRALDRHPLGNAPAHRRAARRAAAGARARNSAGRRRRRGIHGDGGGRDAPLPARAP